MLKVVMFFKHLSIRIKEARAELILKQKGYSLVLAQQINLINGQATLDLTRQIYIQPSQKPLNFQIFLELGQAKKIGGQVLLTIMEYEPNVLHGVGTQLRNSPDKEAKLFFSFYYFHDPNITDMRPFFLSSQLHQKQLDQLETTHQALVSEKKRLEQQAFFQMQKKVQLQVGNRSMTQDLAQKTREHQLMVGECRASIDRYTVERKKQKQFREELAMLAERSTGQKKLEGGERMEEEGQ